MMRRILWLATAWIALAAPAVQAQTQTQCVQVAPEICVPQKKFDAPVNEQPFFGFTAKTKEMIAADEKFLLDAAKGGKGKAFQGALLSGFEAVAAGNLPLAGRRFNQAFLLDQRDSRVYHGFAMVTLYRFRDADYAIELFKVAMKLPNTAVPLRADFGRALMIAKRPGEARSLLEEAVKDLPKAPAVWADLAFARLITRDVAGACTASAAALKLSPPPQLVEGMNLLRSKSDCK